MRKGVEEDDVGRNRAEEFEGGDKEGEEEEVFEKGKGNRSGTQEGFFTGRLFGVERGEHTRKRGRKSVTVGG